MNLGLGYQPTLAGPVSLHFEVRGYFTLINSSSLFCLGGCVVLIKGDALTQAEAMVGLSVAFTQPVELRAGPTRRSSAANCEEASRGAPHVRRVFPATIATPDHSYPTDDALDSSRRMFALCLRAARSGPDRSGRGGGAQGKRCGGHAQRTGVPLAQGR